MRYFKKIVGERLYLSPINKDDYVIYTKWINDIEVSENLGNYSQMVSLPMEQKFLEELSTKGHNYAIVLNDGDELIGNISFMDIDNVNRSAMIGLFIGEKENRNNGYGSEALSLLLDYGFKTLNLHNVMLSVHSDNDRAIACYKKVGFREVGRRREAKYKNGRYVDVVYMDVLSGEFCSGRSL